MGNAWKYTGNVAQPRIEFGRAQAAGKMAYFVRDNGAGFDMAKAKALFQPFQRMHTKDEFPGTGLGLTIAQRIIQRHGGQLRAEAERGKGATFYFTLSR
jgi:light-regulated signal transduction histidine kinase (bacteriophytochrome)